MPKRKTQKKVLEKPTPKITSQTKNKFILLVSLVFVLLAIFLTNTYIQQKFPKTNLSFNKTENDTARKESGPIQIDPNLMKESNAIEEPSRIVIPTANIDLNVVEAPIKDGFWETSETDASHGMGSANPGQTGNSVIFAHARVGLFYNLRDLKKDDVVYVFTQKKWFPYKITEITDVFPNQVEVIAPTKDQRLTLYTCTGYADEKRLIVVAKPIKI